MNFIEERGVNGYLQIAKLYEDGTEEVVFDDHNLITSGMSLGLAYLFSLSGSTSILDYQIDRFQIGTSGFDTREALYGSAISDLSGALEEADYGSNSELYIVTNSQLVSGVAVTGIDFAKIPFNKITRIDETSVRYTLILDKEACNLADALNEVGLFMKNPRGDAGTDVSVLVAYRKFSDIVKTNEFSLIYRWTINW